MPKAIWWIRRDLRLNDNPALKNALDHGAVIPVFILDPALLERPAPKRQAFLMHGLRLMDSDLRYRGSRLILRRGEPLVELGKLASETGASLITAIEDFSPYARGRDERVQKVLPLRLFQGQTLHHPNSVLKADGSPYTIFTPFSKAWKALPLPGGSSWPVPTILPPVDALASEAIPELDPPQEFPPGEAEALSRLEIFLEERVFHYAEARDRMDLAGTSTLSPYLRFGMIAPQKLLAAVLGAINNAPDPVSRKSAETWLNELIWREFYNAILYHFPFVLQKAFNINLRSIPWRDAPDDLSAWQQGHTGFPVVDAAMRQLAVTGWMHNRARMITASFLTKDLLINWQEGEHWFMQSLVDGDPAANNGGWQWSAGTGTDAAPYFRIFNPILQSKKFDPRGTYIRRWVPELANIPQAYIHEPWLMPADIQESSGCRIGRDYPAPIVDRALSRERTLKAYKLSASLSSNKNG